MFNLNQLVLVIKNWLADPLSSVLFVVGLAGVVFGWSQENNRVLIMSSFFVMLNLFLVFTLYVTLWAHYGDIESAYRYFVEIFYVALIALGYALDSMLKQVPDSWVFLKKIA